MNLICMKFDDVFEAVLGLNVQTLSIFEFQEGVEQLVAFNLTLVVLPYYLL